MLPARTPRARLLAVTSLAVLALCAPRPLAGQASPLLLQVHGGVSAPIGSFADGTEPGEGVSAGPSLSVAFGLPGSGWRGLYLGFSQHRFGCEDAGCEPGGRLVATGFDVGFRIAPVRGRFVVPWLRVGAITTRVETDDLGGADAGVSDLGLGGEVGVGVYIGGGGAIGINPQIRYARVRTDLPGGSTLHMKYVIAQLALALAF